MGIRVERTSASTTGSTGRNADLNEFDQYTKYTVLTVPRHYEARVGRKELRPGVCGMAICLPAPRSCPGNGGAEVGLHPVRLLLSNPLSSHGYLRASGVVKVTAPTSDLMLVLGNLGKSSL